MERYSYYLPECTVGRMGGAGSSLAVGFPWTIQSTNVIDKVGILTMDFTLASKRCNHSAIAAVKIENNMNSAVVLA